MYFSARRLWEAKPRLVLHKQIKKHVACSYDH